jgi:ATP-dependent DNA ligase
MPQATRTVSFIEVMECLPVAKLPEGPLWTYELKLDGYRMEAVKAGGKVRLHSRRGNDLTKRFATIAAALADRENLTARSD